MIEQHKELSDDAFIKSFKDCTLEEAQFTHEAHLRLAWLQIHHLGEIRAIQMVTVMIMKYTKHVGAESIFNLDLTVAAVKLVAKLDALNNHENFDSFMASNPMLKTDFKGLILEHYGIEL